MSDQARPGVGVITWTDLTVEDAEKIKAFYAEVVGWRADYPDPDDFLRAGPVRRFARWHDEVYGWLLDDARSATDPEERMALYRQSPPGQRRQRCSAGKKRWVSCFGWKCQGNVRRR